MTGKIERIVAEKGFGFIKSDADKNDIFFHLSGLAADDGRDRGDVFESLTVGQRVSFEKSEGPKGARAANIRLL